MKVVINACYGGFSLSNEALILLAEKKGITLYRYYSEDYRKPYQRIDLHEVGVKEFYSHFTIKDHGEFAESKDLEIFENRSVERNDPDLIEVVEQLGPAANGRCAELKIIEIPDDVQWHVEEYDGWEHIAEDHRTWH